MELTEYSKRVLGSFIVFLLAFVGMVFLLAYLHDRDYCKFTVPTDLTKADIFPLLTSLPFVAFYLVVLLAATAGYARSSAMAEKLPINKLFKAELQKRSMKSPSITSTIRSGIQTNLNENIIFALNNLISSRLPILAVVGEQNKVIGAVTGHDLSRKIIQEYENPNGEPFEERIKKVTVAQCDYKNFIYATINENLKDVTEKMVKHQLTKLIVVDGEGSMKFVGTIDMLDLVSEVISNGDEEKA